MRQALVYVCVGMMLGAMPAARAQGLAGGPPPDTTPPDPRMLPGDRTMTPDLSFIKRMNTPAKGKVRPEPGSSTPGPTLQEALTGAQAALAACKAAGFNVAVVVLDTAGHPRAGLAEDGADGGHIYTGVRKALLALAYGKPNSAVDADIAADPQKLSDIKPTMIGFPGAVPLMKDGKLYGAIGASGAPSLQDEKCAAAGAAAMR